jgi:hypothetical protein
MFNIKIFSNVFVSELPELSEHVFKKGLSLIIITRA